MTWHNFMDLAQYTAVTLGALFVIIDPFAVLPMYLDLTSDFDVAGRRHTRRKAVAIAAGMLICFAAFGMSLFNVLGITMPAFQIAGGILLLSMGMAQLSASRKRVKKEEHEESLHRDDVSVFPLATPLLAGPGAISTVVLHAGESSHWSQRLALIFAIIVAMALVYIILKLGPYLYRIMGQTGLNLMTRLMGILLTAIAIQFIINGVTAVVRKLTL